jgi:DNA modification methylase
MELIKKKVSELIPYINNSRTHSEEQITQLISSIKEFGFTNPILLAPDNSIIAGHGRLQAVKRLGHEEVPCIIVQGLTKTQIKTLIIADNQLALNAGWDLEKLSVEIEGLEAEKFDLNLLGFEDEFIKDLLKEDVKGLTDEDAVPEVKENPKSKLGDIFVLGNHRLMCGDCTEKSNLKLLLKDKTIDLVFTDPPYRMDAQGGSNQPIGKAAAKLGESIKHLCDFDPIKFLEILPTVFKHNTINSYIFCNKDLVPDYLKWCVDYKFNFNILFWKKPNAIPLGGQHRPDVEYLLFFRKSAIWNNALNNVNYSKCLEYNRDKSTSHPTMKPVDMINNQILISSNKDSNVLDFFGGSGSTLISCEKLGRNAFILELDPKYCDVIIQRWQQFTGKEAIHEQTGKTYNSI